MRSHGSCLRLDWKRREYWEGSRCVAQTESDADQSLRAVHSCPGHIRIENQEKTSTSGAENPNEDVLDLIVSFGDS